MATEVLEELRGQRDTLIPERLLQQAYGVAVIPAVTKVALILGGRRGSGVLTVRDSRGHFSNPVFINLTGGSVGWQFGAQETDIVLVFTTKRGIEGIADGKLTLGAGASVAAGPVGRQAEAAAGPNARCSPIRARAACSWAWRWTAPPSASTPRATAVSTTIATSCRRRS